MKYYNIWNSGGDTQIEEIDPSELVKDLANGEYGNEPIFLDSLPPYSDTNDTRYWPEGFHLIIKGEIVIPQPVKIVQGYKIE